jgi:orotate phosphoribosyltransferase
MQQEVVDLLAARQGHFRLESGHHGDLWLDLELLCLHPEPVRRLASELAKRLARYECAAVCGPLVEGAFVGLMVASELDVEFCYAERLASRQPSSRPDTQSSARSDAQPDALFQVEYRVPPALRARLRGKRVAIVNDVINAGSAVRGTFHDLIACGAQPIAIGALLVLGDSAFRFANKNQIALESLATLPNAVWTPAECPLCATGVPLENQ